MTKTKVALIEFDYHAEVLRNTLHILDQANMEVTVFTSAKIWKQVNWENKEFFRLVLLDDSSSFANYLKQQLYAINSNDIVLFNTVASNYKKWAELEITSTTLLRIHNANAYFSSFIQAYKPKFSPFYLWKDSSHFVRKTVGELDWHFRKNFLNKIDHFVFPDEEITNYSINKYGLSKNNSWTLPFGFWEREKDYPKNSSNRFKICVIGRVDQRNRDYETIVLAIKELIPKLRKNNQKIDLVLLGSSGSSYGKSIARELIKMSCEVFKLYHFDGFVPQTDFDQHIAESDFFIIPTKIETRYTIYQEKYGYTKISGSINDVIKYHKPALINSEYPINKGMKEAFLPYSTSQELAEKILLWITSKEYEEIDFAKVLEGQQLSKVQETYRTVFNLLIQHRD